MDNIFVRNQRLCRRASLDSVAKRAAVNAAQFIVQVLGRMVRGDGAAHRGDVGAMMRCQGCGKIVTDQRKMCSVGIANSYKTP